MQTDRHISELGRWQTAQRGADPRLRPYVHGYFASSSRLPEVVRERHVPSAEVALLDEHQLSEGRGERHFMVVRFTPVGAHLFLGLPMRAIAGQAVELGQIDGKLAALVMSRAGAAQSWSDRFAAMESLIAGRIA